MQSLRSDSRVLRRAAPSIAFDGGAARRSCADRPQARNVPVGASQAGYRRRSDTWVPLGLITLVVIPVAAGTLRLVAPTTAAATARILGPPLAAGDMMPAPTWTAISHRRDPTYVHQRRSRRQAATPTPSVLKPSGRPPLWNTNAGMQNYAYRGGHAHASSQHRAKPFRHDAAFARLRPYRTRGQPVSSRTCPCTRRPL